MSIPWAWPPVPYPPDRVRLADGTILTFGTPADGEYLVRSGLQIVGAAAPAPPGATLVDQFIVQLGAAFSTADTTSPGTVCISQVIDVPANAWIVVVCTYSGNQTGTTGTPRAEILIDGTPVAKGTIGAISTAGNNQAGSLQFAGDTAAFGGVGNHTIALAFYTAGTGTINIDPTTSVAQHADINILVFVG